MRKISFSRSDSSFVERFLLIKPYGLKFSAKNNVAQGPWQNFLDRPIMVQSVSGPHHEMRDAGIRSESKYEPWAVGSLNPQKRQGANEAISVSHVFLLESFFDCPRKNFQALYRQYFSGYDLSQETKNSPCLCCCFKPFWGLYGKNGDSAGGSRQAIGQTPAAQGGTRPFCHAWAKPPSKKGGFF
jgi:hypothetical protein